MENPTSNKNTVPSPLLQEDAFQLIVDHANLSLCLFDHEYRIIIYNEFVKKRSTKLFGAPPAFGSSVMQFVPPSEHAKIAALFERVFNGETVNIERQYPLGDETKIFDIHLTPVRNDEGKIIAVLLSSFDISTSRATEIRLSEAEERWRFALEGANQGAWDWNIKTGDVFYSPSYKRLYGFNEDDSLETISDWKSKIHPDDQPKMENALAEHMASSDPFYETRYRIKAKDGSYKWIWARGMVMGKDENGQPLRMIGTHTDITDQVNAEQHYKNLFKSNPLPCWIYETGTGKYLEVNEAALTQYGFTEQQFLASSLYLVHPQFYHDRLTRRLQEEIGLDKCNYHSWMHQRNNGELVYVDITVTSINHRGFDAKLVVAHDVTGRVHAEKELRKSNERFYYAAKAATEALWEWDLETGQFYASEAYTDIFGWKVSESRTFDEWHEYIHPLDRDETIRSYYSALADPNVSLWKKEYRYLKSDGTYAPVIDKASILRNASGQTIRVVGAIQDLTEQKKSEEDIRLSNERFRILSRATSDAIYDWNIITGEVYWGDAIFHLFGFPPGEIDLKKWEEQIHLSDRSRISKSLEAALKDPLCELWKEEYRFGTASGAFRFVLDRAFILRDDSGNATRVIGSMQDITERHNSEQLLSLEKTIFELSTNPKLEFRNIVLTLLKGIEELNEDAYTSVVLLRDNETVEPLVAPRIPRSYSDAFYGDRIGPRAGSCGAAMYHKKMVVVEDIATNPVWDEYRELALSHGLVSCWSIPIIHSAGQVMGSFAIYYRKKREPRKEEIDVFERIGSILRVLMENHWFINHIKEANERFDIMMKATHDLVWDWNLENNVIYRDEIGLKKVYGINDKSSIEDFNSWLERIHPEDHNRVATVITEILQSKKRNNFDVEYRFRRDDGTYSNVYDRGIILRNSDGKPLRMIGAAQDVTERKRLQQELLDGELEKQKAINQATVDTQEQERSEIGKELHDNVNQVLTTTKLYLDLSLSSPELKDELIQKSTRNIINVINEIRQLSRSLMDPSIGDLGLVASINDLVENINLTRKLHVKLQTDRRLEPLLDANQKLTVFRIIQETLNNAIRHAKATIVSIKINVRKSEIHLTIEDDGVGFDLQSIKKGAGLKNIQNRIYLINGTYSIETAPGKGCKIIIKFPFYKKPQE